MFITTNTELGAINAILFTIGESPVNSLDTTTSVDVINARALLADESRRVQDMGWTFNTTESVYVQADAFSHLIDWRQSWLRVLDAATQSPYSKRGNYLYDRVKGTDQFPQGVTLTTVDELAFDDIPYCFQSLVACKAARRFNGGAFGDPNTSVEIERQEKDAWMQCQTFELDYGRYTIFQDQFVIGQMSRR